MNIKEQFITPTQSIELHKLGFNEQCIGYYDPQLENSFRICTIPMSTKEFVENLEILPIHMNKSISKNILLPLWIQAFDWFTETHGLSGMCYRSRYSDRWRWRIGVIDKDSIVTGYSGFSETTLEAKIACLDKLINLVKNAKANSH